MTINDQKENFGSCRVAVAAAAAGVEYGTRCAQVLC
jgi:hypothetical protein